MVLYHKTMKMKNKSRIKRSMVALLVCSILCLLSACAGEVNNGKTPNGLPEQVADTSETTDENTSESSSDELYDEPEISSKKDETVITSRPAESTVKSTEKVVNVPKTEPQTKAKKEFTAEDNTTQTIGNDLELSTFKRDHDVVIQIKNTGDKTRSDEELILFCGSSAVISVIEDVSEKSLEEYDIDSVVYEVVNKDGNVIYTKVFK